jgi:hypothetical protein
MIDCGADSGGLGGQARDFAAQVFEFKPDGEISGIATGGGVQSGLARRDAGLVRGFSFAACGFLLGRLVGGGGSGTGGALGKDGRPGLCLDGCFELRLALPSDEARRL